MSLLAEVMTVNVSQGERELYRGGLSVSLMLKPTTMVRALKRFLG